MTTSYAAAIDTVELVDHVQLLSELVAIDSINPDLVPGAAGEERIARYVADWMRREGLETALDEAAPGRLSAVGVARGSGGGRPLMLNAHLDTVGVAGMEQPHTPRVEGGRLYGRGAYDMKGSLAAILLAGARVRRLGLRGDVIITAVCDEEYASIGTSSVLKRWTADAAIVTEPTGLDICVAHKGFLWFEVQSHGVAAHGSKPESGVDAIAKTGRVLTGIEELDQRLRAQPRHSLLGSGSIHASLISGGQELSSYPEHCGLSVERRTVPGESQAEAEAQMAAILEQAMARDPAAKFTCRTSLVREPFEVDREAPIVRTLDVHVAAVRGAEPLYYGDTPWMDAALTSAAGVPTVVFGPGGGGAHAVVEWSNLDEVAQAVEILTRVAQDYCG
jgi:acetylornithine deacetylase